MQAAGVEIRRPARNSLTQAYRARGAVPGAGAGDPVVAADYSGIQVMALRSYLKPLAALSESLVAFITKYHLLLSLVVTCTALKGTATSFSPMPRKPPTPMIRALILPPSRST